VWECIKKNNSFLCKRNGHTKRSGKVAFSSEKGNLKSLNLLKYSGIANTKVADVVCTEDNKTSLIIKTASKAGTMPSKSKSVSNVPKDFVRSVRNLKKLVVGNYYRRDLHDALLGKYTKVYQANRRARGIIKTVPTKKGRTSLAK
jgi:Ribosomal L28e protein family